MSLVDLLHRETGDWAWGVVLAKSLGRTRIWRDDFFSDEEEL